MLKVCCFKKIKSLSFVGKEKFLKSDGIKSNHENVMKSNYGNPFHHEYESTCFWVIFK